MAVFKSTNQTINIRGNTIQQMTRKIGKHTVLKCDFVQGAVYHRLRFGGGRGQHLPKAVGMKGGQSPAIIDATAGLGRDAFLLASLGSKITLIERSKTIHGLLAAGMEAARQAGGQHKDIIDRMTLIYGDSIALLPTMQADVVLVDPMHPCLLYTSPSPRDLSTSRMPSSA